jgi:hypothetical protein
MNLGITNIKQRVILSSRQGGSFLLVSKTRKDNMINLIQETKCSIENCNNDYIDIVSDIKYCLIHTPNKNLEIIIKFFN